MRDTLFIGRYSKHDLGDLYYAVTVYDRSEDFTRFIAWLCTVRLKFFEISDENSCSWVFDPEGDGAFWLKMFWCANVVDEADHEYYDESEEWASIIAHDCEMMCLENEEIEEEETIGRMLRCPSYAVDSAVPMWSPLSRPRANRRATIKSKGRKQWVR